MNRFICTLAISLVMTGVAQGQCPIVDPSLKSCVEAELGMANPTCEQIQHGLTKLNWCAGEMVRDLTGLECATNLAHLVLDFNQIKSISALAGLTNLTYLRLDDNEISDISALSDLTNLTELTLWSNEIVDIPALAGLTNLYFLNLAENKISDISALAGLTNLTGLHLEGNKVSDVSALAELTNLAILDLANNEISDISALAGLTKLNSLDLTNNPLNRDACEIYIPMIIAHRPLISIHYDPCVNNQYTLTTSSAIGGSVAAPGEGSYPYSEGSVVPIVGVASEGYVFTHWSGAAVDANKVVEAASPSTTVTVDNDYTLVANFEPVTPTGHTLDISSSEGGEVVEPGEGFSPCDHGQEVDIVAQADPGYLFTGWSGTAAAAGKVASVVQPNTTVTVDDDYTLIANFAETPVTDYTLIMAISGNGSVVPDVGEHPYLAGTEVQLDATPDPGHRFTNWSGDVYSTSSPMPLTMNSDYHVTANFELIPSEYILSVNVNPIEGGSVIRSPSKAVYSPGESVTLRAAPAAGYTFTGWSGDLTGSTNPTTIVMDTDHEVMAHFQADEPSPETVTMVSMDCSPEDEIELGDSIEVNGSVEPRLSNVEVTVYLREGDCLGNPSSDWQPVAASLTNHIGDFTCSVESTKLGNVLVKAKAGNVESEPRALLVFNECATGFLPSENGFAFKNWGLIRVGGHSFGAHCLGMSLASVMYYSLRLQLPEPGTECNPRDTGPGWPCDTAIAIDEFQAFLLLPQVWQEIILPLNFTPWPSRNLNPKQYSRLETLIRLGCPTVVIVKGHAITAYKIRDYECRKQVYFYDSNLGPEDDRYFVLTEDGDCLEMSNYGSHNRFMVFDPSALLLPDIFTQLVAVTGHITGTSEPHTQNLMIDNTVARCTYGLVWPGSDLDLTLTTPSGVTIDPPYALQDPGITYIESVTEEYYAVEHPESGQWQMHIAAVDVPPEGEDYTVSADLTTNLRLTLSADKETYDPGEPIAVTAEVIYGANGHSGSNVEAQVQTELGVETITLFDDGQHNDAGDGDGVYANIFANTAIEGQYTITATASGLSPLGEPFLRQASRTVFVQNLPDLAPVDLTAIQEPRRSHTTLTAHVRNDGTTHASDILVGFYDVNNLDTPQIGVDIVIDRLDAGEEKDVSTNWDAPAGTRTVFVVVDRGNTITEADETNNSISQTFTVQVQPVAHWKFDEAAETTASDSEGNSPGAVHGATWSNGLIGGALRFDGADDHVDCGDAEALAPEMLTLAFWMFAESSASDQYVVGKAQGAEYARDYTLCYRRSAYPEFFFSNGAGESVRVKSTSPATSGQWVHIAAVRDGSQARLYVNGVLQGTQAYSFAPVNKRQPLTLGGLSPSLAMAFFRGKIDDVRLYDQPLSAEEIEKLYLQELP